MKKSIELSGAHLLKPDYSHLIDYKLLDKINLQDCRSVEQAFAKELQVLQKHLKNSEFGVGPVTIGSELEMALVNKTSLLPSMVNMELCQYAGSKQFQTEISKFCLEYNGPIIDILQQPLSTLMDEMQSSFNQMSKLAEDDFNTKLVTIGIMPTVTTNDLGMDALTPYWRYYSVDKLIKLLRCNSDFLLDIHGENPLRLNWHNTVLEGVNSSFQVHLRVNPQNFNNYYNAAQLASAFVLSLSGNSPMLFGHKLWEETRIAVFEQIVNKHNIHLGHLEEEPRVNFGRGWSTQGVYGLFKDICELYYPIFPLIENHEQQNLKDCGPNLRHIIQHNSAIWTWNRPIYDPAFGGHFRIEMRYLPSGPTIQDMVMNAGFMLGLTRAFADNISFFLNELPFKYVKYNFYQAAQYGLSAKCIWPDIKSGILKEIDIVTILDEMLKLSAQGLSSLGVSDLEIQYIQSGLKLRLDHRMTGAVWQRQVYNKLHKDHKLESKLALKKMFEQYIANQDSGLPIAHWRMNV